MASGSNLPITCVCLRLLPKRRMWHKRNRKCSNSFVYFVVFLFARMFAVSEILPFFYQFFFHSLLILFNWKNIPFFALSTIFHIKMTVSRCYFGVCVKSKTKLRWRKQRRKTNVNRVKDDSNAATCRLGI